MDEELQDRLRGWAERVRELADEIEAEDSESSEIADFQTKLDRLATDMETVAEAPL